jgi:hypothetical protein
MTANNPMGSTSHTMKKKHKARRARSPMKAASLLEFARAEIKRGDGRFGLKETTQSGQCLG